MKDEKKIFAKAERLYKKVRTFFLTYIGADGYPLTKAVVPGKFRKSLGELYFSTNTSSKFVEAISKSGQGSVYFYSKIFFNWKGCNLKGNFEIVTDITIKKRYWRNFYKNAYPERAYTDPDFCLVRFLPAAGRLYANFKVEDFKIQPENVKNLSDKE